MEYATMEKKTQNKIFVVCGKTASGKSTMTCDLSKHFGIPQLITCTTRPPRDGETDGVDYHFMDKYEFTSKKMIAVEKHETVEGEWWYGINSEDLDPFKSHFVVTSPSGYHDLKEEFGDRVFGIYILTKRDDRCSRYLQRDRNKPMFTKLNELNRRLQTDDKDFYEFELEVDHLVFNRGNYADVLLNVQLYLSMELMRNGIKNCESDPAECEQLSMLSGTAQYPDW